MSRGEAKSSIALDFHAMLIGSITRLIEILALQTGIRKVVLSGGCMQNSLLLEGLLHTLKSNTMYKFTPEIRCPSMTGRFLSVRQL